MATTATTVNGERIRQAREVRAISQSKLSELIDIVQPYLSNIEAGLREPSDELVERIALATQFPATFFRRTSGPEFPLGSLLFRRRESLPSDERDRLRQTGRLAFEIFEMMAAQFKALDIRIPRLSTTDAEQAAHVTRTALGLSPDTPITHLINRLERNGVFVLLLPLSIQRADAFSVWADTEPRTPVIVLTGGWPGDRQRFSVAHELGHLVMHQAPRGSVAEMDADADSFASELLLPHGPISADLRPPITLTMLAEMKSKWGVSMQAIARRAEQIGLITEGQRKYLEKQMGFKGWIKEEPVRIQHERPRLFRKMAEMLYGFPTRPDRVAAIADAPPKLVEEILHAHASKTDVMRPKSTPQVTETRETTTKNKTVIEFRPRRAGGR
jgi:Zn-dependent peptidase ImmA (M78 family)/DNA-binding XRE family transcriptional regulator